MTHTPSRGEQPQQCGTSALAFSVQFQSVLEQTVLFDLCVTCSGVGDREPHGKACGCPHLLEAVGKLKPKYHVMGHIHSDYGVHKVELWCWTEINCDVFNICGIACPCTVRLP